MVPKGYHLGQMGPNWLPNGGQMASKAVQKASYRKPLDCSLLFLEFLVFWGGLLEPTLPRFGPLK